MQGAIAAGNRVTAEAGASVLADGGNAIDACIVAAFSAAVTEGPLTGPTGGGFLLAWFDGEATVLDCFFAAPSQPLGEMEEIVIDFGDASTQIFHVGEGSVAVPGLVAGARGGAPPVRQPAVARARRAGDRARPRRARRDRRAALPAHDPRGDPAARRGRPADLRRPGADRDRGLRRRRWSCIRDTGSAAVAELLPELAGDLARYRVAAPEPLRTTFGRPQRPRRRRRLPAAARSSRPRSNGWRPPTPSTTAPAALRTATQSAPPLAVAGTTQISVIDADGNAAAFSSTLGSGSGSSAAARS